MMFHLLSSDANGQIDGTARMALYDHLPLTPSITGCDAVIVPISHYENFRFNEALNHIKKPIVVMDFMEYFGFLPLGETHWFGSSDLPRNIKDNHEWQKLDAWVADVIAKKLVYFKRELFDQPKSIDIHPIEWPCMHPAWAIESKQGFDGRPFEVFYNWGYSNHLRPQMQASIFSLMAAGKIDVISNFDHVDAKIHEPQPKWIAIHSPHTHRRNFTEIALRQAQSKCSISLPGSGACCFRSVEAPLHTVPVICDYGKRWSIPWGDGENCIMLPDSLSASPSSLAEVIRFELQRDNLHEIYVNAQQTLDRYRTMRYINEYVIPTIQRHL